MSSLAAILGVAGIGAGIAWALMNLVTRYERQFYEGVMYCAHCGHPTAWIEKGGHAVTLESKGFKVEP